MTKESELEMQGKFSIASCYLYAVYSVAESKQQQPPGAIHGSMFSCAGACYI